jgi:phosphoglycerate dehydrogenase-like enzyme
MQVIAWSENLDLDKCKELECIYHVVKEDLIKTSDYISIHVQGGERYTRIVLPLKSLTK